MHNPELTLIHTISGSIVVSFHKGNVQFYDPILHKEMETMGIFIPPFKREEFEGRKYIFPEDPLFQKAFVEVYYPLVIANPVFQWKEANPQ